MTEEELWSMMKFLAAHIPEMAILFLGVILAFANWRKHPRPALLSFFGFGGLLGLNIVFWVGLFWFEKLAPEMGIEGENFAVVAFTIRSVVTACAYLLLIAAIYTSRKPRPPVGPSNPMDSANAKR